MISVSILGIKDDIRNNVHLLDKQDIDYMHIDIMDGEFVSNKTWNIDEISDILDNTKVKKDIHLMVKDVKKYVDDFKVLKPCYITFHYEAINNVLDMIKYIKSLNIKVGLSIKPNTKVEEIIPYLSYLDLVLVMSVEPGLGGQKFIENSVYKIDELYKLRNNYNYHYVIEVDGGINNVTSKLCKGADILVVGSFITSGNYEEQIRKITK